MFAKGLSFTCATRASAFVSPERNSRFRHLPGICFVLALLVLCCGSGIPVRAQFYEYGQDAGSLKWNQFSSEHFRIIYPAGIDSLAMRFADRLEYYYPHLAKSKDNRPDNMPVIIHNESSFSNGVFVWAPRRLEIFTNPDPNGYPRDWLSQLAIHEGRHAFQVTRLNQGFTRGLSFIGGEQALGAMIGFLPLWYLEGDAVDAETRLSRTGRGRQPSFEMGMKALMLERGERYSFSKALLGSYKDYVPNHYQMGYLMVRYGRRTYGDTLWSHMEQYVARKPYTIFPTYISNRKFGVRSKQFLYRNTLNFFASHWDETYRNRAISPYHRWSPGDLQTYTHYRHPRFLNDSALVTVKSGMDQIPEFIILKANGEEKRLFQPGYMNSGRFSLASGKIAWDEWIPDWRWSNRNFSAIRVYDMETGKVSNLGSRTRLYAPALSNDGNRVAAVEQRTDHTFRLTILDLDGNELYSLAPPGNSFIQHPAWTAQDSALVVTLNHDRGESLYLVSPETNTWREVFHAGFNDISFPEVNEDRVFFSATFSGIDNIYAAELNGNRLFRMTGSAFGAFEPSVSDDGSSLAWSDYHADGYQAVSSGIDALGWEEFALSDQQHAEQIDSRSTAKEMEIIRGAEDIPLGEYRPGSYSRFLNAVNVHSWLPLWFDYLNPEQALSLEEIPVKPGFTILSQNLLSTVIGQAGYEYSDGQHYLHSGVVLKGKVPVLDLAVQYGGEPNVFAADTSVSVEINRRQLVFNAHTYVPVRLNTGKFLTAIQPLVAWRYSRDYFPAEDPAELSSGSHRMLYRLYFTSSLRRSTRDIWPRLGITTSISYRHAPFDRVNLGSMSAFSVSAYLPGLFKNQSLKLSYASQEQSPGRFFYGNIISLPRGIEPVQAFHLKMVSLDYATPLLYPDLAIEPVLFIKRIRATGWVDYMLGREVQVADPEPRSSDREDYLTTGIDLLADIHLLRTNFPVAIGSRLIYIPGTGNWKTELLLNVTVN